jgi:protein-disulfide isomerase
VAWLPLDWGGVAPGSASRPLRCAQGNDRFWDYHDYLFHHQGGENRGQFAPANLRAFAAELGLDTAAFNACLDAGQDLRELHQAFQDGRQLGITATPFFVIGSQRRAGVPTVQQLSALLDAELARVGR